MMTMTRAQLRHQAACARYQAGKLKPPTRMQARQWLKPIRDAFAQMRTGEVDSIRGYAVTRLHTGDDYARIDFCINGFVGMIERVMPDLCIEPMKSVSRKLEAGVPLVIQDLETCAAILNECEDRLITITRQALIDASVTEQINIEIEQLGLKKAA